MTNNKAFACAKAKADLAECDLFLGASSQMKAIRSFQQSAFCFPFKLQVSYVASEDPSCGLLLPVPVMIYVSSSLLSLFGSSTFPFSCPRSSNANKNTNQAQQICCFFVRSLNSCFPGSQRALSDPEGDRRSPGWKHREVSWGRERKTAQVCFFSALTSGNDGDLVPHGGAVTFGGSCR